MPQLWSVLPPEQYTPPPPKCTASLPMMVQSVSVLPPEQYTPPPESPAVFASIVQLSSVGLLDWQ